MNENPEIPLPLPSTKIDIYFSLQVFSVTSKRKKGAGIRSDCCSLAQGNSLWKFLRRFGDKLGIQEFQDLSAAEISLGCWKHLFFSPGLNILTS